MFQASRDGTRQGGRWRRWFAALGTALALPGWAAGLAFDEPEARLTRQVDTHSSPAEPGAEATARERLVPVERNCLVYRSHAVLWVDDPWVKGATEIQIRTRPRGMKASLVCGDGFQGRSLSIAPDEAYPWGVIGHYLFLQSADGAGALRSLRVHDLDSGKKLLDDAYHEETGITLARTPGGLELTYWTMLLRVDCVPRAEDPTCWARIRAQNGVPRDAEMAPPECQEAVAMQPSVLQTGAVQIAVGIRVRNFARDAATFLAEPPTCDPAP